MDGFILFGLSSSGEEIWIVPGGGPRGLRLIGGPDPAAPPSVQAAPAPAGQTRVSTGELVAFANHVEGEVHLPDIQIGMNPRLGMVAVPTWFWVQPETYHGQDLTASDNLVVSRDECSDTQERDESGAVTGTTRTCNQIQDVYHVEVRLSRPTFIWDFGDGTVRLGSLGHAYPTASDVAHAYNTSSLQVAGGYPVDLQVIWSAGFQVSGTTELSGTLADAVHAYGPFPHPVQEAQAVLTGR